MDIFGREPNLGMSFTAMSNPHAHPMSYSTATGEFTIHEGAFDPPIRFAFFYSLPWLGEYAGQGWEKILLVVADHVCSDLATRFGFWGDLTVIALPVLDASFHFYVIPAEQERPKRRFTTPGHVGIAKETTFGAPVAPARFLPVE